MKASYMIAVAAFALSTAAVSGPAKSSFSFRGMYVEGCSCQAPCPCELTGVAMGCEGVGAFQMDSGTYMGVSLAGMKFAYATVPGEWVACYVDCKSPAQSKAAKALCAAAFSAWGKMAPTKDAKISITGSKGTYRMTVNGGKVMDLTTTPVMGGDGKHPIAINNINSQLHSTVLQGKTGRCTYNDGGKSFDIKGTNAYYNDKLRSSGKL